MWADAAAAAQRRVLRAAEAAMREAALEGAIESLRGGQRGALGQQGKTVSVPGRSLRFAGE